MLHTAIDGGVNYVDTAYVYHDGASEGWLAEALAGGYRERVKVATKHPVWKVESAADFDRYLDEQLGRLGGQPIDFYLLHGLERETWRKIAGLGALEWAQRALADGRIGHIGFSFHDEYEVFTEIVDARRGHLGVLPDPAQLHGRRLPGRVCAGCTMPPPAASA